MNYTCGWHACKQTCSGTCLCLPQAKVTVIHLEATQLLTFIPANDLHPDSCCWAWSDNDWQWSVINHNWSAGFWRSRRLSDSTKTSPFDHCTLAIVQWWNQVTWLASIHGISSMVETEILCYTLTTTHCPQVYTSVKQENNELKLNNWSLKALCYIVLLLTTKDH